MLSNYIGFSFLVSTVLAGCPTDTACDPNFEKCYKYVSDETTYLDAEENCQQLKGHLTSIENAFENEAIKITSQSMFNGLTDFWVGGHKLLQSTWNWTDGTPWSFTNWQPGMPDNLQCLSVNLNSGQWTTAASEVRKPYVCSLPYNDGISPTPHNVVRTTTPTCTRTPFCEDSWTSYKDYCYRAIPEVKKWEDAEKYCMTKNAHLVSIHSEEENTFVSELAGNGRPDYNHAFWIGTQKINDQWFYTDGTKFDYVMWCKGNPDASPTDVENYIMIFPDGWTQASYAAKCWDDYPDATDRNFVCKKPKN